MTTALIFFSPRAWHLQCFWSICLPHVWVGTLTRRKTFVCWKGKMASLTRLVSSGACLLPDLRRALYFLCLHWMFLVLLGIVMLPTFSDKILIGRPLFNWPPVSSNLQITIANVRLWFSLQAKQTLMLEFHYLTLQACPSQRFLKNQPSFQYFCSFLAFKKKTCHFLLVQWPPGLTWWR